MYTRYSPNQFLVLLMEINQEDCEITYKRIYTRFKELCPGQKIQIRYYVSSIAGVKTSSGGLSFGKTTNRWKTGVKFMGEYRINTAAPNLTSLCIDHVCNGGVQWKNIS